MPSGKLASVRRYSRATVSSENVTYSKPKILGLAVEISKLACRCTIFTVCKAYAANKVPVCTDCSKRGAKILCLVD